jgi:PEP-CTERM motif
MNVDVVKCCSLALMSALLTCSAAQAGSNTLTAPGGLIADANGEEPVESNFTFADDDTPQTVTSIERVTLTGLTHDYVSDLYVALVWQPDDPLAEQIQATLFDGINDGEFFLASGAAGDYSFTDTAVETFQEGGQNGILVMPGTYRPTDFYLQGESFTHPDLDALFAGVDLSMGQFMIHIEDAAAPDSGVLLSATLELTTVVPEPTSLAALGLAGALVRRRRC